LLSRNFSQKRALHLRAFDDGGHDAEYRRRPE
jgi:hypothetical protein